MAYVANLKPRALIYALCAWLALQQYQLAAAQAIDPDTIVFTTMSLWKDLRVCLQKCFDGFGNGYAGNVADDVGCSTNSCLCRADTLGEAIIDVQSRASVSCSDIQDETSATSILIAYCSGKGYTSIVQPTILQTTGASTVTVTTPATTVTAYYYETIVKSGSSAVLPPQFPILRIGMLLVVPIVALSCFRVFIIESMMLINLSRKPNVFNGFFNSFFSSFFNSQIDEPASPNNIKFSHNNSK